MDTPYNIFDNSFYDVKPATKWSFTAEFVLSDKLTDFSDSPVSDIAGDPPEWLKSVVDKLKTSTGTTRQAWMDKLSKSITKIPIVNPTPDGTIPLYFPGYSRSYTGRYKQSGILSVSFNDNINRDVRCILEQLIHTDSMGYGDNPSNSYPVLPKMLWFNIIVTIYDVEKVNLYESVEGSDSVSEHGAVKKIMYESCYVTNIPGERNSYEGSEEIRTVEAQIAYQRMVEL